MVEIPDAAVEAGAQAHARVVMTPSSGVDYSRRLARAVLEAATVEIRCPLVPAVPAEIHVHCGACGGSGTLRVLRTGETRE